MHDTKNPQPADDPRQHRQSAMSDAAMEHEILGRLELLGLKDEPEVACEMLDMFLHSCRELLTELELAVGESSAERCRQAAHTLKGTSRNIGATQLGELSFELQSHGDADDMTEVDRLHRAAQAEFSRVERFLLRLQADLRRMDPGAQDTTPGP
jgi:HPt (histidine-containing phosphotransfer) domain-containing protein